MTTSSRTHILVPVAAAAFAAPAWAEPDQSAELVERMREAQSAIEAPRSTGQLDTITSAEPAESAAAARLHDELDAIVKGRVLGSSTTAVYIVDAFTGEPIYERHIDEPLNPASNVKLVSTAAALDVLGAAWRYKMRVFGPVPRGGAVAGDLYLRGGADPTLRADDVTALAQKLADAGVERVEGDIVLGPYRVRDSVGVAPIKIRVSGEEVGEPPAVELDHDSDFFEIVNEAVTVRRGRARVRISKRELTGADGEGERVELRIRGRIRQGRKTSSTQWIVNRAGFTAHTFRKALEDAGVTVEGGIRRERFADYAARAAADYLPVELARHESAPLRDIVARVNKPSNNFLADRVAMTAGAKLHGGTLSMSTGLAAMDYWLARAGLDPDAIVLDTGSGLSYETKFSARQVVDVLRAGAGYLDKPRPPLTEEGIMLASNGRTELSQQARELSSRLEPSADDIHPVWARDLGPVPESFLHSLAVAGVDGTLARRFRTGQLRERMIGKTGTLTNIIALSGFVTDRDDNKLGFAIITNDHRPGWRTAVRNEQGRMVEAMYRYLESRRQRRDPDPSRPSS